MIVEITVSNKIAAQSNDTTIICGNSDFVAEFIFDSEWDEFTTKTARFVYRKSGESAYYETEEVFNGNTCRIPPLSDVDQVRIGVYAGNLHTTTPAIVKCRKSILCGSPIHAEPPEDVYNQLVELVNNLSVKVDVFCDELEAIIDESEVLP